MQLSDKPRGKKYPANSPQILFIYFLLLLKKMQYGKTSYARQDQT
jgi:hypothetical protein